MALELLLGPAYSYLLGFNSTRPRELQTQVAAHLGTVGVCVDPTALVPAYQYQGAIAVPHFRQIGQTTYFTVEFTLQDAATKFRPITHFLHEHTNTVPRQVYLLEKQGKRQVIIGCYPFSPKLFR